jgi:hypothetical protein
VEVLRKLWVNIFIRRITTFWTQHNVLHRAQHGCTRYQGTEPAIMQLASVLETAKEEYTNLFLSSWDMRRAFDSISKPFQAHAWHRLGVPIQLTEYLVAMDAQGLTYVRCPLTTHLLHTRGAAYLAQIFF